MLRELERRQWQKNGIFWAFALSAIIIIFTGLLARITLNIDASVIENPDLAVIILLKDERVVHSTLLRENGNTRHYLVETKQGSKLVIITKEDEWKIEHIEDLHDDEYGVR